MGKIEEKIELTTAELELGKFILEDKKRMEILKKLMKSDMYYNQLCEGGGSRAAIADALDDLVSKGILTFKWQVKENKPTANPAPFKAVKMFHIEGKYRQVIEKLRL
jgi:hypothetical protein